MMKPGPWLKTCCKMKHYLYRHQPKPILRAIVLAGIGTSLAVAILAAISQFGSISLLVAPFGATCVLLFTAHSSPLSQPINVVGGHFVSACVGFLCHIILPSNFVMDGLAVGLAVMAMMALRVVHPPAGATAMIAYFNTTSWMFLFFPILIGSIVLVGLAMVYHAVTKTVYPLILPKN